MAEKRFLDLTGLQKYDALIKGIITAGDAAEREYLNNNFKVKTVATSETVELTNTNGTVTAKVTGNVVVDADYAKVKENANNSATAWNTFLTGSNGVSPKLSELATKTELGNLQTTLGTDYVTLAEYNQNKQTVTDAIGKAKGEAVTAANNHTNTEIGKVNDSIATKVSDLTTAITTAQNSAVSTANAHTNTEIGKVNDSIATKVSDLTTAINNAKTEATNANNTLEAALNQAISIGDTTTLNSAIEHANDIKTELGGRIDNIAKSIIGGVHFRGQVNSVPSTSATIGETTYDNGDIVFYGDAEYILVKNDTTTQWLKLGDTTAEAERLTALETAVNVTLPNAINKAETDANAHTDTEIGKVNNSISAINTLIGKKPNDVTDVFSGIATAKQNAENYADQKDTALKTTLIGVSDDAATANTIYGAKAYAQEAANTVFGNILSIDTKDINALFGVSK